MANENLKPLDGVKVLDLSRLLPGPLATRYLSDLGADVVKVEHRKNSDGLENMWPLHRDVSVAYQQINNDKRKKVIDFFDLENREEVLSLINESDIVIESFRPGVLREVDLDWVTLKKKFPKLLYCSLTGYGQTGPYKNRAGHDLNFLALSGLQYELGIEERPVPLNFQIADLVGCLTSVAGILSGLYFAEKTGKGMFIDISLLESALFLSVFSYSHYTGTGGSLKREGEVLSGKFPWYNIYETNDGRFLVVATFEKKFWQNFCHAINRTDWIEYHGKIGGMDFLKNEVQQLISSKELSYWEKLLRDVDCCVTPVKSFPEALQDPHLLERQVEYEKSGLRFLRCPIRVSF